MQSAYNLAPKIGRVGALAESSEGIHAFAKVAGEEIPFGCMTVRGSDDMTAMLPASADDVASIAGMGGVAVATHAIATLDGPSDPTVAVFPAGKEFAQLRRGPVFVLVEEAVTQGDQAYVRFAASENDETLTQKGAFRKSADTKTAVDSAAVVAGCYFKTSAAAGELAVLEVNLGGK